MGTTIDFFDTKSYDRDSFARVLAAVGLTARFHEFRLTSETATIVHDAPAVCVFVNDRLDRACFETLRAAGVRHVALRCAGFNNVDLEAARTLGIAVTRVPAYSPHAVAEHTVALLLALNRRIHRAYNRVRDHNFSLHGLVGLDLYGRTVGVIGTGKIGRLVAQILLGFGMRVIAHDPYPATEWARACGVAYLPLDEVLAASDVLTLHLPLNPQSHHLLDERALALVKPGATIVNTSRGKLVDTTALIAALKARRLGGVALDVYEEEEGVFFEDLSGEPLADDELSRLLTFPNVIVTAHQAFLSGDALAEIARVTTENLARGRRGESFLEGTVL
ncbi:2-hydroxyacid dehydrogenase [Opitutales bacterium ASA1]|uniref:2-hydroxyacid dehydrogenase n=1 Tax=Congregicoccus parvus TaxID=3081749 RepID=UPI002B285478|nr:2-hydroxyacid dehydrogenase [Opitutales bacterium ASA1]